MSDVNVFDTKEELAEAAAKHAVDVLKKAIDEHESAAWVLAGGTTPQLAYKIVAANHKDDLDWSKVTFVMGDERIGPNDGPDNNWHTIEQILGELHATKIFPNADQDVVDAAGEYEIQVSVLPKGADGLPRFDLVWLGVGQDGHTLSLFPAHESLLPSGGLVAAIRDAPKPPRERITLTLRALQGATNVMILAAGEDKKQAITDGLANANSPIGLAASIVKTHSAHVTWLVDKAAAPTD